METVNSYRSVIMVKPVMEYEEHLKTAEKLKDDLKLNLDKNEIAANHQLDNGMTTRDIISNSLF